MPPAAQPAFDLAALIAACRPGYTLPRAFYADEAVLAAEQEKIFRTQWLYAGHLAEIPNPGDYFTWQLGDDPILVTRAQDGEVHALYNVCRHRGSTLCADDHGHCKKLVCPYHQWVFDLDGTLQSARQMPADFDRAAHALHRLHVRVMEGLIFVCAAATPPDFTPVAAGMTPILRPYGLTSARQCERIDYDVQANWKLVVENSRECYHCHFGHPEYTALMLNTSTDPARIDACNLHHAERRARYEALGLTCAPARGPGFKLSRYPLNRPGAVTESETGAPVAPLMGTLAEPDAGVVGGYWFPNFMIECSSDYTVIFRFTPVSARRTAIRALWLVRAGAQPGGDYQPDAVTWFWRVTGEQDWKLCADNQTGVNSTRYTPGPYAPEERETIGHFADWYLTLLNGQTPTALPPARKGAPPPVAQPLPAAV